MNGLSKKITIIIVSVLLVIVTLGIIYCLTPLVRIKAIANNCNKSQTIVYGCTQQNNETLVNQIITTYKRTEKGYYISQVSNCFLNEDGYATDDYIVTNQTFDNVNDLNKPPVLVDKLSKRFIQHYKVSKGDVNSFVAQIKQEYIAKFLSLDNELVKDITQVQIKILYKGNKIHSYQLSYKIQDDLFLIDCEFNY